MIHASVNVARYSLILRVETLRVDAARPEVPA